MVRVERLLAQAQRAAHRGLGRDLAFLLDEALSSGADRQSVEHLRRIGSQNAYERSKKLAEEYADVEPHAALDHLFEAQRSGPHRSHEDEHDLWVRINTNLHYIDLNDAQHAVENGPDANDPEGWLEYALRPLGSIHERSHKHQVAPPPEAIEVREAIYHAYADHYLTRAEQDASAARTYVERVRGTLEEADITIPAQVETAVRLEQEAQRTSESYRMQPAA